MAAKRFSETHEWVEVQNNLATVGIAAHAAQEIGETVYVELPKIGAVVKAGEDVAVLESTKAAIDISSPISGQIVAINEELKKNPKKIALSPEGEGWLFQIELTQPAEIDALMSEEAYAELMKKGL
ncbi:MAG: gcvH [Chlamydiia bacterium]|nr:gcvH [Chlamydiia bacterium]